MNLWSDDMLNFLNIITSNLYLYFGMIAVLLILDSILIIMAINEHKRRKIKKDFEEVESEQINVEEETSLSLELQTLLEKMEEDLKAKPEDVVRQFEESQEENAIISYQELVDNVKAGKIEIEEDDNGTVDFVSAIEGEISKEPIIESIGDSEVKVTKEMLKEAIKTIEEGKVIEEKPSFKNSEILSPVFGRVNPDIEYNIIPGIKKVSSNTYTNQPIELSEYEVDAVKETYEDDIKKNEDFLKSLIDFRKNL